VTKVAPAFTVILTGQSQRLDPGARALLFTAVTARHRSGRSPVPDPFNLAAKKCPPLRKNYRASPSYFCYESIRIV
jgi:hypothetical protein